MSNQGAYNWAEETKKTAPLEEQIDPSFSRDLQPINQFATQESQQPSLEEGFDVAAAAVAVSNDNHNTDAAAAAAAAEAKANGDAEARAARANRPLTNTKRAEQNRVAQRNFRQRKEQHIRELEIKAKETDALKQTIEALKQENIQLRDYSLALQAKLIEQPDVPNPPVVFSTRTKKE